jgi:predicted phage tail protein
MELKGKPLSLGAKILGAFIAVAALAVKATVSPALDIDAAIKTAAFVVVIFAPVDLSMVLGNIFSPLGNRKNPADTVPYQSPGYPEGGGR